MALSFFTLAAGTLLTLIPLTIAIQLFRADKVESKRSARRTDGLRSAILGRARTRDDWVPDGRVKGGMVYNRKKKRIEISGRLSNDTLDRVFRS